MAQEWAQESYEERIVARYGAAGWDTAAPSKEGGAGESTEEVVWNDTIDLLAAHRSVRAFLDRPVDDATLNAIAVAAQSAASSSYLQVVSVVAVRDPETIRELAKVTTQEHVAHAPLVLVWLVDHARLRRILGDAPQPWFGDYLNGFVTGVFDAGLAAQNAVVAAESLGLGTVYLGSLRNDVARVAEILHLPDDVFAVVGLSVGWPDPEEEAGVKPRLPLPAFLHHERYGDPDEAQHLTDHERAAGAYYARYGLDESWIGRVRRRVADGRPARNRAGLSGWLREHGFGLR